ncbi:MAG: type III secretion system chaperone [Pseudomonadota bacterium]
MTHDALTSLLLDALDICDAAEAVEVDAAASWLVIYDAETALGLDHVAETGRLVLSADIGEAPEHAPADLLRLLLVYNSAWRETGGMRAAVDADDVVSLVLDVPFDGLDASALAARLDNFTDATRAWRSRLRDAAETRGAAAPERDASAAPLAPDPVVGALRV